MKVAHHEDYDTHAVIGGREIEEFAIAQTAEFFTVLSNTLYSNKPLAVIREVLCNAWDAHIVVGREDVPIEITLTDEKLSIRDHGPGIPHEDIHQIYCVYGSSTKENDGKQTGGFGLGSKAPFAYSDHFTVTNCHGGIKTVHAISRGSAITQGKPDRRVMVTVPTEKTGVEVLIPVKDNDDAANFAEIIKNIAAYGEMNVILNGEPIETIPISQAENNLFLTTKKIPGNTNRINIRYGNVVYPVYADSEYIFLYNKIIKLIEEIPHTGSYGMNNLSLILQAPPNSISVTPSRESLSLTETTLETLRVLFTDFIKHMEWIKSQYLVKMSEVQDQYMDRYYMNGMIERLLFVDRLATDDYGKGDYITTSLRTIDPISDADTLIKYIMIYKRYLDADVFNGLLAQRMDRLIAGGFRRSHDLKCLKNILTNSGPHRNQPMAFYRKVFRPLLKRVFKHPELHPKHLFIVKGQRHRDRHIWSPLQNYIPEHEEFLPLVQGVIFLTQSKIKFEEEYNTISKLSRVFPIGRYPRMVYLVPRRKGLNELAEEYFKSLGYYVVNFTKMYEEYYSDTTLRPLAKKASKREILPKPEGLPLLSGNLTNRGFINNVHLDPGKERSTDYDYVMKAHDLSSRWNPRVFPWGVTGEGTTFARTFGDRIGMCVNTPQVESQMKKGKKDALVFIAENVSDTILTNPRIRTYIEIRRCESTTRLNVYSTLQRMAEYSSLLKKTFLTPDTISEDESNYIGMFDIMCQALSSRQEYEDGTWESIIKKAQKEVDKWAVSPAQYSMINNVESSQALKLLRLPDMIRWLKEAKENNDISKRIFVETVVLNAFNI